MPIALANGIISGDPGNGLYEDYCSEKNIRPNPGRQEDFASLPDDIYEAFYGGGNYGGKTWILALLPLFKGMYKFKGFKGILLRRKHTESEKEIIRLTKEYYPATGSRYNEQKHSWEWKDYNTYLDFGHVQHDKDIEQYDTAQYNYGGFDELTSFTSYPYHYMIGQRIRPGSDFNVAIARSAGSAGGVGHTFVYNRFVKYNEDGYVRIKDVNTGLSRIFIPALAEDNPKGMEYDPTYVKKLEILKTISEALYRARRYGDWHAFKGSVFTTFRPIRFPGEPENALHVIKPFAIPEWWPRILSIDWGKRAMCYAMWGAISPQGRVYVYRERAWKNQDLPYWATEIKEIHYNNNETPILTILCGSAWQNRGTETIADEFQAYSNLVPTSSDNSPGSRVAGLQLVQDFMRWEKLPNLKTKEEVYLIDKAQEIYRRFGPAALEEYKKQFYDEPEEKNLPILQIFDECKVLIETIPVAMYNEDKGNPEDIAEFDGDDPLDDLRYFCKGVKRYLNGEVINLDLIAQKQKAMDELAQTQDMTRFYRNMERLEKKQSSPSNEIVIPTSRFSRFGRRRFH